MRVIMKSNTGITTVNNKINLLKLSKLENF